ncbi:MAG: helix-turn-helix domain-containing protein [Muribaculum sp.]|nr:helix-turn-helix domain-containing protein [Muribaculum sp.]
MEATEKYGILFSDGFERRYDDRILHVLCVRGSIGFTFRHTRYNVGRGDYAIITEMPLATNFSKSADFEGFIMWLSLESVMTAWVRSNYDVVGKLSLMSNPVMKLSEKDFNHCKADLQRLKERIEEPHLFRDEMFGALLAAHILDLYDIHSRQERVESIPERAAELMHRFIDLLQSGETRKSRELRHYASQLCITPHYLSDISREISGKPAGYWIDRFAITDIIRSVSDTGKSLTEISENFNFRSLSHFSRYFTAKVGMTPSQYRIVMEV